MLTEHQKKLLDRLKDKNRIDNKSVLNNFMLRSEIKTYFKLEIIKLLSECKQKYQMDEENLRIILLESIKEK